MRARTQHAVLQPQASGPAALGAWACLPRSTAKHMSGPSTQDMAASTLGVCTIGPTAHHALPKFTLIVFSQIILSMLNAYECKDNPTLPLQSL